MVPPRVVCRLSPEYLSYRPGPPHGSLEGVGGFKTNEAYHSKADALLFCTFSALLALPVIIREGYGQIAHQTPPNILLSNASLVTKSCIARFVEDDTRKNASFIFHRGARNPSLKNMERWCFTLRSNFPPAMSRLFGNRAKTAK